MPKSPIPCKSHSALHRFKILAAPANQKTPALFLDRDGVIIKDVHHISDPELVEICPGAFELIHCANQSRWPVVVVTNQSGISRGLFDWTSFDRVNERMISLLGTSASISAIFANGLPPGSPSQSWRKPSPLMLIEATKYLNIDISQSIMVGDRLSDLQAGCAASVKYIFHVLSRHGIKERPSVLSWYNSVDNQSGISPPILTCLNSLKTFPLSIISSKDQKSS